MNVVLKPAGILIVFSIIAVLLWLVVTDQAKLLFSPSGAPISQDFKAMPTVKAASPVPMGNAVQQAVDLTRVGATDWVVYGVIPGTLPAKSAVRKKLTTPLIAPIELVGNGTVSSYANDIRAFRYSDGDESQPTGDDLRSGIVTAGVGSGFRVIIIPNLNQRHALKVWVGGVGIRSKLHARMSDGSPILKVVESYQNTGAGERVAFRSLYTVYFRATKPTQKLILSFLVADEEKTTEIGAPADSDVSLQAIALD